MLFSYSSELFLFILCEFFCFVLIRAERANTARVHVMAEKRSVTNLDVYERYVKVFKADADAVRHFIADKAQLVVTSDAQVHLTSA